MTSIAITTIVALPVGLVMGFFIGLFYAHPLPMKPSRRGRP